MTVKHLRLAPIPAREANILVDRLHYSHSHVRNSQLHLGVFWHDRCVGALQFGPPMDKRKVLGLVQNTAWNGCLELNRMVLASVCPKNSGSRMLAIALRLIKKQYPHIEWVLSFADAAQSGDGVMYRAVGFVLTQIKRNTQVWKHPSGGRIMAITVTERFSRMTVTKGVHVRETGGASMKPYHAAGFRPMPGFQLRYLYFLNPGARQRLTVPILPYKYIDEVGARMYKGQRATSIGGDASVFQAEESGSSPTVAL